jgi:hypothetical protein
MPTFTTLDELALQNAPGWVGAMSPAEALKSADLVQWWSGSRWVTIYFNTTWQQWRFSENDINVGSLSLTAGRPLVIRRTTASQNLTDQLITLKLPPFN